MILWIAFVSLFGLGLLIGFLYGYSIGKEDGRKKERQRQEKMRVVLSNGAMADSEEK